MHGDAMHFPLTIPLRPSRAMMASILAAHVAAGSALFHVPSVSVMQPGLPRLVAMLVWMALLLSLLMSIRHERHKQGQSLILHDDGGLSSAAGEEVSDYWLGRGVVDFGWAVWLPLVEPVTGDVASSGRARRRLMLLPTNMSSSHWRPLRIWLRHKAAPFCSD